MDREEHVETHQGIGRLFHRGKVVIERAPYRIDVTRRVHVSRALDGTTSEARGLGNMEGSLGCEIPWGLEGELVELELTGGRRWSCVIGNGRLLNSGGIK